MSPRGHLTIAEPQEPATDQHPGEPVALDAEVGDALQESLEAVAPGGWRRLVLSVSAGANNIESELSAFVDGGDEPRSVACDVFDLVEELRHDHFRQGAGTWYNATFSLERGGQLVATFDFDYPPFGGMHDPAEASEDEEEGDADDFQLIEDHRVYPRVLDRLPAWHPVALEARSPAPLIEAAQAAMLAAAPAGWRQLTMAMSAAMYYTETTITTVMPDGTTHSAAGPRMNGRLVRAARAAHLARHGRPWYTATITLTPDGDATATFDHENPPFGGLWSADNPAGDAHPEMLRAEHERLYTGDLDQLPAWHPAHTRPWGVSIYWLDMLSQCAEDAAPDGWRHLVLDVEAAYPTVRVRLRDIAGENPDTDYAAAYEADAESVKITNEARFNVHVYAPVPGTWYSARFVMDQPDHPDRILVDELDFTTRPFTKIPRPGDDPDSDEHRDLLRHDQWRHPRERHELPAWHPSLDDDA
ncbi:hypothetical protein [Jiangella sp. DSM 45060]|uniref:hypothetical protein n=1 Tax=Jiangella sp. DSM 45060 TaxID=1798224 RepID=UPI00087BBBDB|nr:hypothetical protein [Jiangella sp. DSM 45060]SDT37002.1 hypothetical protein SAMN04515669_3752 [Jiangella sp. DSM 45060]